MKTTITLLKLSAIVGLFLTLSLQSVLAVDIYVCQAGTVKLGYSETSEYELKNGDEVIWVEWDVVNNTNIGDPIAIKTYTSSLDDVALELLGSSVSLGTHNYRAQIISSGDECTGDMSDPVEVYGLPDLSLSLGSPSLPEYCENGEVTTSQIVATTLPAAALPTEIPLVYDWSAKRDASDVDIADVGTFTPNNVAETELTNTFTVNTTTVGAYNLSATVAYASETSTGIKIKGGCITDPTTPATVTVTPKPGTPTITVE